MWTFGFTELYNDIKIMWHPDILFWVTINTCVMIVMVKWETNSAVKIHIFYIKEYIACL